MSAPPAGSTTKPWSILGVLCIGFFMTLLDLTIVNIALPSIITGLNADLDNALWVYSGYTLAFAALLIVGGRLGDYFGPRRVYLLGIAIFVVASVGCGLAQSVGVLIAARCLEGVGGALIAPQLLPITTAVFSPDKWGAAFGLSAAVSGLAILAGPTIGGVLVNFLSWRWIFFVNVPIGIVTALLVTRIVPDLRPGRRQSFGLASAALLIGGLGMISFALIEGERLHWHAEVWSILLGGVMLVIGFALLERSRQRSGALVPFSLFGSRNFTTMSGVIAVTGFAMLATFLPLTIYLQSILQMSSLHAGLTIAAMPVASMLVAGAVGNLATKHGGRGFLVAGLLLFAAGILALMLVLSPTATSWRLLAPLVLIGLGTGLIFAPLFTVAFSDLDPQMSGAASGVINTSQELGGLVATAIVGAVLQVQIVSHMRHWVDQQAAALPEAARAQFRAGFSDLTSGAVSVTTSGPRSVPPNVTPEQAKQTVSAFGDAFESAMRVSYLLPLAALLIGVLLAASSRRIATPTPTSTPAPRRGRARPDRHREQAEEIQLTPEPKGVRTMTETGHATVMGIYQIKNGREDEAVDLVRQHWPLLHRHGLVTDEPARIYKGEWGSGWFILEVATWFDDQALHSAFSIPEIAGLWRRVQDLAESRNGRDGVEYPVVAAVDPGRATVGDLPGSIEGAVTGIAIHQIRPECVDQMHALLPREWAALEDEGFVPEQHPLGYLGTDKHGPFSVSILDWHKPQGPQQAFMNPTINAIWRDVQAWTTSRANRPASEYLWGEPIPIDQPKPARTGG